MLNIAQHTFMTLLLYHFGKIHSMLGSIQKFIYNSNYSKYNLSLINTTSLKHDTVLESQLLSIQPLVYLIKQVLSIRINVYKNIHFLWKPSWFFEKISVKNSAKTWYFICEYLLFFIYMLNLGNMEQYISNIFAFSSISKILKATSKCGITVWQFV